MLYFKDRGLQIGWATVFLAEYAGPLLVYLWVATRPWLFYGEIPAEQAVVKPVVNIAAACWAGHYAKRILETLFVHRFSNATMPIKNLFINCSYYWGFAAYVSYHINHPLYTAPCDVQVYGGLAAFILCELGNLSIHWALRCLRPAGNFFFIALLISCRVVEIDRMIVLVEANNDIYSRIFMTRTT